MIYYIERIGQPSAQFTTEYPSEYRRALIISIPMGTIEARLFCCHNGLIV